MRRPARAGAAVILAYGVHATQATAVWSNPWGEPVVLHVDQAGPLWDVLLAERAHMLDTPSAISPKPGGKTHPRRRHQSLAKGAVRPEPLNTERVIDTGHHGSDRPARGYVLHIG